MVEGSVQYGGEGFFSIFVVKLPNVIYHSENLI
jgi:hypothetical protein